MVVPEVGSTNAELMARVAAGEGIAEGSWLVADRQTAGHGRAGRRWFDGAGNFMGSTVVHLRRHDPAAQTLALVAGLAAAEALATPLAPARPLLKWPNDLLVGGAKLGGILLERQGHAVIVGIGINIACAPSLAGRATTCLAALGATLTRDELAERLAGAWSLALGAWHQGAWQALRAAWLERAHPPGARLMVRGGPGGTIAGTFAGLAEDGAARLRLADGSMHVIHAGDVELVGGETVSAHAAGD